MANFLKFYSEGGGTLKNDDQGSFIISIDEISGNFGGSTGFNLLLSSPTSFTFGDGVISVLFTTTGPGSSGRVIGDAIMDAILAGPGGNINFTMPQGYAITSFEFQKYKMANYLKIKGLPAGFPGATPPGTQDLYLPIESITAVFFEGGVYDAIKILTNTGYGENGYSIQMIDATGTGTATLAEVQSVIDAIGNALFSNSGNGVAEVQGVYNKSNSIEYTPIA